MIHTQQTKRTKYNYIQHRCILQNNAEQNILDTKEYILFYPIYREFKRDKQWIMLEARIMATVGKLNHILFLQVPQLVKRICLQWRRLPAMQETWVQSPGQDVSSEKEMANHSNSLAWEIPWTEEPSALQSKLQWVGNDLATNHQHWMFIAWMCSVHENSSICKHGLCTFQHACHFSIEILCRKVNIGCFFLSLWPEAGGEQPFCDHEATSSYTHSSINARLSN